MFVCIAELLDLMLSLVQPDRQTTNGNRDFSPRDTSVQASDHVSQETSIWRSESADVESRNAEAWHLRRPDQNRHTIDARWARMGVSRPVRSRRALVSQRRRAIGPRVLFVFEFVRLVLLLCCAL